MQGAWPERGFPLRIATTIRGLRERGAWMILSKRGGAWAFEVRGKKRRTQERERRSRRTEKCLSREPPILQEKPRTALGSKNSDHFPAGRDSRKGGPVERLEPSPKGFERTGIMSSGKGKLNGETEKSWMPTTSTRGEHSGYFQNSMG